MMKSLFRFDFSEDSCIDSVVFRTTDLAEAVNLFTAFFSEHMLRGFVFSVTKIEIKK